MPSGSVSPVTRPKRVRTPTLPVGIEVVLHNNRKLTTIASQIGKIREPASRLSLIGGSEPPRSAPPPRVTLTMTASIARLLQANAARSASIIYHAGVQFRFLRAAGIECANSFLQAYPNILWSFRLTPRRLCARIRANIRPSQGNRVRATSTSVAEAHRSLRGERYAVFARLHRAMH